MMFSILISGPDARAFCRRITRLSIHGLQSRRFWRDPDKSDRVPGLTFPWSSHACAERWIGKSPAILRHCLFHPSLQHKLAGGIDEQELHPFPLIVAGFDMSYAAAHGVQTPG